jgi:hypothetical protein
LSDVHGVGKSLTLVLHVQPKTMVKRVIGSPASTRSQPNRPSSSAIVGARVDFVRRTPVSLEPHDHTVVDKVGIDIVAFLLRCTIRFLTDSVPLPDRVAKHLLE